MAHIVRIDKPKNSPHGTHSWQVRVGGKRQYHSRLFSDRQYGGQQAALVAAQAYLESYLAAHPQERARAYRPYHQGKMMSNNKSGVTGVCYFEARHRWDKGRVVGYWCASLPTGPEGQKPWHKKFNIERYGVREARRLAIEFRREWEAAVNTGNEKALVDFFEEYHYSRLVGMGFGYEEWDTLSEGLFEIEASL